MAAQALRGAIADTAPGARDRVLVFADAMSATQHISFVAPLAARRAAGEAALCLVAEAELDALKLAEARAALSELWRRFSPTVVVISRQASRHVGWIVRTAREHGTRLVAHLDDDLFDVPDALGAAKAARHNHPARRGRLEIACRRADAIYASTPELGRRLAARFADAPIVAGEIYCAAQPPFARYAPAEEKLFGYMGTAGHVADLESVAPAIAAVLEAEPDAMFEVFGTIKAPASLKRFGKRVRERGPTADYDSFLAAMRGLKWRAGLAPIDPIPFNACKADTKFVEYAQAGIPAVLTESVVYRRPLAAGAARAAANAAEWQSATLRLLRDEGEGAHLAGAARALLESEYSLARLEAQMLSVLRR